METLGPILAICALLSLIGTAIYSRRTYEELVKLNQTLDEFMSNRDP